MDAVGEGRVVGVLRLARYVLVGGLGTALNAGLYLSLRSWWDGLPPMLSALVLSTLVSTELNRRFTFAARREPWRMHLQSAGTVAFYAGYGTLVLGVLELVAVPTPLLESAALAVASVFGGLGRYLVLRHWVFAGARGPRLVWPATLPGPVLANGSASTG